MRTVYSSADSFAVEELAGLLRSAGIACRVLNSNLGTAFGDIPPVLCALELVVDREEDLAAATAIAAEFTHPTKAQASPWRCPKCGESLEGSFTACWACGTQR